MTHWNTRGRTAVAVFDPSTRHSITHSQIMITSCAHKPLLWVVEQFIELSFIGGFTGPQRKVERFLCLLFRMLQISPSPSLVLAMLRQDVHKYLRTAALVYIRLLGSSSMLHEAKQIGLADYRKIRVYGYPQDLTGYSSMPHGSSLLTTAATQLRQQQEALFGRKRRRGLNLENEFVPSLSEEGREVDETGVSKEQSGLHEKSREEVLPHPSQFYLTHVDEITACLYGSDLKSGKESEVKGVEKPHSISDHECKSFLGSSMTFLGFSLPSIDYIE